MVLSGKCEAICNETAVCCASGRVFFFYYTVSDPSALILKRGLQMFFQKTFWKVKFKTKVNTENHGLNKQSRFCHTP